MRARFVDGPHATSGLLYHFMHACRPFPAVICRPMMFVHHSSRFRNGARAQQQQMARGAQGLCVCYIPDPLCSFGERRARDETRYSRRMYRAPPRANRSLHMVTAFLEYLNSCFIRPRSLISRLVIRRGNMSYTRPNATMSANHSYCPRKHRNLRVSRRPAMMHDDGHPTPTFLSPLAWTNANDL